ncbi:MAG: hypothetical protein AVDCRST_MAG23-2343 [uncultured Sphingosinicella sp.]|uniref:Uncharacterized protein n=1 Tax=uncultured Sphingosinicella sp. TaxID=478748 RepID=A0A6J4UA61_9SPHN|nr:MAG: hypothetical protein AVDCRST_MAG23-2343 [uncultured Sphingosinicella sp.]
MSGTGASKPLHHSIPVIPASTRNPPALLQHAVRVPKQRHYVKNNNRKGTNIRTAIRLGVTSMGAFVPFLTGSKTASN